MLPLRIGGCADGYRLQRDKGVFLLKAQQEPEKYGHIIVRVCGFSAPFVLLSPQYQEEFLTRYVSVL